MLIEKQTIVDVGDVVTIKLMSGEELIGRLVDQTTESITLGKPVTVALQPISAKEMGLSFLPVLGSVEPDVTLRISKSALSIQPVRTAGPMTSSYIETTSGLITPAKNGIIV